MAPTCRSIGLLVLALAVPANAVAQAPAVQRPFLGLFGGNPERPRGNQELNLNASMYGAYDDNVLADASRQGINPMFQESGGYAGAMFSLDYWKRGERGSLDVTGGSSYRYYPSLSELTGFDHRASLGFTWRFSDRTSFGATESVGYSPYYSFRNFPGLSTSAVGQAAPAAGEFPIDYRPAITYSSSASIDHRLTRRATLSADYSLLYTDFRTEGAKSFDDWRVGSTFNYRLTRNATARLGYHYRRSTYSYLLEPRPIDNHDINAGIDYSKSLSIARRTTFGFTTGSSIYRSYSPTSSGGFDPNAYSTQFTVTGTAYLNRQFGRQWNARLDYRRGVEYVEGFVGVFLTDAVTASLTGMAGSRTRLSFSAAYSGGDVSQYGAGQRFDTYMGNAEVQVALASFAALFADYSFYHYGFGSAVVLPPGMPGGLDRNGVRAGLSLWLPLLR
jgi:hypothetical protein